MTEMTRKQALLGHKRRLRNLTDTEARNLMEHAANKTPLLPVAEMPLAFVDVYGRC